LVGCIELLVGAYGWGEGAFLGFVGCLWVMSCVDTGFACEVVHVPRNAAASSKKRPTLPHRHPPAPLLRPRRRQVPLQQSVFMGGAVARCCFLAESEDRQKRGKCERNGVVSASTDPEPKIWAASPDENTPRGPNQAVRPIPGGHGTEGVPPSWSLHRVRASVWASRVQVKPPGARGPGRRAGGRRCARRDSFARLRRPLAPRPAPF
jgi:hypothetical protein